MKRTLLAVILAMALPCAFAQYSQPSATSDSHTHKSSAENPPLKTIRGTISEDGKTFTPDKGKQTWTLKNPEEVKGHEGHHVDLNAHVYKGTHELHVMKVTMVSDKK